MDMEGYLMPVTSTMNRTQQLDAARDAVFRTMRKNARAKAALEDELRTLDLEVATRAAAYDLREEDVRALYLSRMEELGRVNKNENSEDSQVSKLKAFWWFGHNFGDAGVAFVRNWIDRNAPYYHREKLLDEMRKRTKTLRSGELDMR